MLGKDNPMMRGQQAMVVLVSMTVWGALSFHVFAAATCSDSTAENNGAAARCQYKTVLTRQGEWMTLGTYCQSLGYGATHKDWTECYNEAVRVTPPITPSAYPITCADGSGQDCVGFTEIKVTSFSIDSLVLVESEDLIKYRISLNSQYTDHRIFDTTAEVIPWIPTSASSHYFLKPDQDMSTAPGSIHYSQKCSTSIASTSHEVHKAVDYKFYGEDIGYVGLQRQTKKVCDPDENLSRNGGCITLAKTTEAKNSFISSGKDCLHQGSFPIDRMKFCLEFGYAWWENLEEMERLGLGTPVLQYVATEEVVTYTNPDGTTTPIPQGLKISLDQLNLGAEYHFTYWVHSYVKGGMGGYAVCYLVSRNLYFYASKFFLPIQILIYICTMAVYMGPSYVIPRLATLTVAFLTVINSKNDIVRFVPKGTGSTVFDSFATMSMYYLMLVAFETIAVGALQNGSSTAKQHTIRMLESSMKYFMLPVYHLIMLVMVMALSMDPASPTAIFSYVLLPVSLPFLVMCTCALHHNLISRSIRIIRDMMCTKKRRVDVAKTFGDSSSSVVSQHKLVDPSKEDTPFPTEAESQSHKSSGIGQAAVVELGTKAFINSPRAAPTGPPKEGNDNAPSIPVRAAPDVRPVVDLKTDGLLNSPAAVPMRPPPPNRAFRPLPPPK